MEPLQHEPSTHGPNPSATTSGRPPALWRNGDYRWWLATDTSTGLGRALHNFAVPLLALYVTGDPAQAGIIAAIGQAGRVVATLPGGVLADRHDRRRLILLGTATGVATAGALAAFQLAGLLGFWLLTILNLLMNVRSGLFDGVPNAALKSVVEPRSIGSAMAANHGRQPGPRRRREPGRRSGRRRVDGHRPCGAVRRNRNAEPAGLVLAPAHPRRPTSVARHPGARRRCLLRPDRLFA
ncbi:MFS transporter [Arthrobacter rhombi]|uniref:MFS transporter n=1 Tax=Arthrobacter rhombi TaxID=71253 RepID=UPI003FD43F03